MRWIPFAAWLFIIASFSLSLFTLIAGTGQLGLENDAILTLNTSSIGMEEFLNSSSPISQNISSLLPPGVTTPPSLTKYLGMKDWYSMHYLSTCSGFFAPSTTNPSLLSSKKVNITCSPKLSGYTFNPQYMVQEELNPSVKSLSINVTQWTFNTAPWIALWYTGFVFVCIDIILLPLTFNGTRRVNGYCALFAMLSYIAFDVSAALATGQIKVARRQLGESVVMYPIGFLALAWFSVAVSVVAFILEQIEWRFELWTFKGDKITMCKKPQLRSWSILEALTPPPKVKGVQPTGRDYEFDDMA